MPQTVFSFRLQAIIVPVSPNEIGAGGSSSGFSEGANSYEVDLDTATARRSAPRGLQAAPASPSAVALSWRADSCAKAYLVSVTNSEEIHIGLGV